jgi:glycosyltransferase involved in cell wall biosynthesis
MPKVSVIIPNYNHAQFLEQRIDSVLNQTFQDFEVIFLDDASTDNSFEVFYKYANHPKISHAIFNEINSGSTFKQWNKGLSLATGEYIWIAESDDYARIEFLDKLVPILDEKHNIGLAYCQSCLVDQHSQIISENFLSLTECFEPNKWNNNYWEEGKTECKNFLAAKNTIPNTSAVLFKKSVYEAQVNRQNEIFQVAGDWFTWLRILMASDIYFLCESLNYHRFFQGSVSRNPAKVGLIVQECLSVIQMVQEQLGISEQAKKISFATVSNWWLNYLYTANISWKRECNSYQRIIKLSPSYVFILSLHWELLQMPMRRLKYKLKLKHRLKKYLKKYIKFS